MTTFKLSVLCDSIEEFQRVASLLLAETPIDCLPIVAPAPAGVTEIPGAPAADPPLSPPPAPKRSRGRPKVAAATLPGILPAPTIADVQARAKAFVKAWGAPSLTDVLGAFRAKTILEVTPNQYVAILKAFEEFTMNEDEPEPEPASSDTADPFNDLL